MASFGDFLFLAFDGTGSYDATAYKDDFQRSFLKQICNNLGTTLAQYVEGPGWLGQTCGPRVINALKTIAAFRFEKGSKKPIYLAGYSRGGAVAQAVADGCRQAGTPIKAMFLLDPVSWDGNAPGWTGISSSVETCFVMCRWRWATEYSPRIDSKDYAHVLDKAAVKFFGGRDSDRYARKWMGNCSLKQLSNNTVLNDEGYVRDASHGAMGGVPWIERELDRGAVQAAAERLNKWLRISELFSAQVIANVDYYYTKELMEKWSKINASKNKPPYVSEAEIKKEMDGIAADKKREDEVRFDEMVRRSKLPDLGKI